MCGGESVPEVQRVTVAPQVTAPDVLVGVRYSGSVPSPNSHRDTDPSRFDSKVSIWLVNCTVWLRTTRTGLGDGLVMMAVGTLPSTRTCRVTDEESPFAFVTV